MHLALAKADCDALRDKLGVFQQSTGTNKLVNWVVISTFGIKPDAKSLGIVAQVLNEFYFLI